MKFFSMQLHMTSSLLRPNILSTLEKSEFTCAFFI